MFKFLLKRIIYAIVSIWAVVTITFTIMMNIPGSPFTGEKKLPEAVLENLNRYYNLDKPIIVQYFDYLGKVVRLDFGPSMTSSSIMVNNTIENGLPISMRLGVQALIVAIVFGLIFGIVAALNHNKIPDYIATILAIIGVSVPSFIMARILVLVFSLENKIFPTAGWASVPKIKLAELFSKYGFALFSSPEFSKYISVLFSWKSFSYTVLPTIALSALTLAQITRIMRSNMLEVMGQDYIRTAKAKGVKKSAIIMKHAVRNAILPVITILGTAATNLVTGSFVIERIFGIPGIGENLIKAVGNRDYPVIIAITVVYSSVLIILTLAVDIAYIFIDPRIKLTGGAKGE